MNTPVSHARGPPHCLSRPPNKSHQVRLPQDQACPPLFNLDFMDSNTPSVSPFIPAGTYQQSSNDVQVTLSANCYCEDGGFSQSSLTFTQMQLEGICDISNDNGTLTLVQGEGFPNPVNTGNPFVPAGSYQNSASNIEITIQALCRNDTGINVPSSILYSLSDTSGITSIANTNGMLCLFK